MHLIRKVATTLCVAALTATGVLATSSTAFAGGNGQQVKFYDGRGCTVSKCTHSIMITGYDQNDHYAHACVNSNGTIGFPLAGWWWKGAMTVDEYTGWNCQSSTAYRFTFASVPANYGSDWWDVWNTSSNTGYY
ncbi:hypothetical protein [Kitasatospora sp. NPDC096140]|uniref:hypothetical protein n=1 Tax=Kitasatospora sp. NPDC096140 TaxID=3155425 RepID=UPI003317D1A0